MPKLGIPTLGWLTAALLTLITIFVFGTLQNYGPDSTVRKFHQAAMDGDSRAAAPLVWPDFDSAPTQELWGILSEFLRSGKTDYQITHYQRKANQAAIVVRYRFPQGGHRTLIWIVQRINGKWRIDTKETTLAARYLLRPPSSVPFR